MTSIVLGLIAALCWGVVDILGTVYSRRHGTVRAVAIASIGSLLMYLGALVAFPQQFSLDADALLWMGILGAGIALTYLAFYGALRRGPLSVVAPILSSYAALILVLSVVLLGEDLSATELVGALLAITGVIACSTTTSSVGSTSSQGGPRLAVVAMVGFALSGFGGGILAKEHGWLIPPLVTRVVTTVLLLVLSRVKTASLQDGSGRGSVGRKDGLILVAAGVIEGIGFLAFSRGAEVGLISLVAVSSAVYPLIPMFVGVRILKERVSPIQWVGASLVLGGMILLGAAQ